MYEKEYKEYVEKLANLARGKYLFHGGVELNKVVSVKPEFDEGLVFIEFDDEPVGLILHIDKFVSVAKGEKIESTNIVCFVELFHPID